MNDPIARSHRRYLMAFTAGIALVLLPGTISAQAQSNCDWYAKTALKQQKDNEDRKCGLKGEAWHSDMKAHLAWCAGVAPDVWKSQAQKREQELAGCAKK